MIIVEVDTENEAFNELFIHANPVLSFSAQNMTKEASNPLRDNFMTIQTCHRLGSFPHSVPIT